MTKTKRKQAATFTGLPPEVPVHPVLANIWATRDIHSEPIVDLDRWRVFQVQGTRVLFGRRRGGTGRRSSPIVAVDATNRCVGTQSGRMYRLVGPPGFDDNAEYVLEMSRRVAAYTEVTEAFCSEHGIDLEGYEQPKAAAEH